MTHQESQGVIDRLVYNGCRRRVAELIAEGVTVPRDFTATGVNEQWVYLAGPMRGHDDLNFPAFDEVRNRFVDFGFAVISPADIDRADNSHQFDYDNGTYGHIAARKFAYRDFHALHLLRGEHGDGIVMLPGWEKSTGATAEFFLARWMQLVVYDHETGRQVSSGQVEMEADRACRESV